MASLNPRWKNKERRVSDRRIPLHLRDAAKWATYPALRPSKGTITVAAAAIPRVLKSEKYMSLVAHLSSHREEQKRLLLEFVRFVLSDEKYVAQLWSIGHSYYRAEGVPA
jgi:hypothetical protein